MARQADHLPTQKLARPTKTFCLNTKILFCFITTFLFRKLAMIPTTVFPPVYLFSRSIFLCLVTFLSSPGDGDKCVAIPHCLKDIHITT
ncbi:hypothetical protein NQ318_011495 [Aromia moschata]|uniref:Transmembrane protein n=1 Tax=Aromia moschata TaxID=1265417 RepID=A0AAV8XFG3_9CUCU|nr:hypothetical protein NQ318_011495 [Aromia moschata]